MAPGAFEVRLIIVRLDIDRLARQILARAQDCAGQTQCKDPPIASTPHDTLAFGDRFQMIIMLRGA